jgi:LytS/YehU family sensor histidine kinase
LIIKEEQIVASQYLSKFSKLLRSVLVNSKHNKVPLADELEALKLYIEMEALQFKDKFEYEIIIDDGVDINFLEIPPILIQPYVENSIWHGLMHKTDGKGKLMITLEVYESTLICAIQDNGVGREAANKLKSKSALKQKSHGMEISQKRLQYNNQETHLPFAVEIIDLKDSSGKPSGTRIILNIAINLPALETA